MRFLLASTLLSAFVLASSAGAANLLANPSFESSTATFGGDGCVQLLAGSTALTGWTVVGSEISPCRVPNAYQLLASEGTTLLDLTGYASAIGRGVSQSVAGLVPGRRYVFRADLGISNNPNCVVSGNCAGPVSVLVEIGAIQGILTHNSVLPGMQWGTYQFEFVADSPSPLLRIRGSSMPSVGAFIGLDNLSLAEAPPVPSVSWPGGGILALTALIAGGVAALRRGPARR